MSEEATTTQMPEEMVADLAVKAMWFIVASMTIGIFILIETILLNKGCSL